MSDESLTAEEREYGGEWKEPELVCQQRCIGVDASSSVEDGGLRTRSEKKRIPELVLRCAAGIEDALEERQKDIGEIEESQDRLVPVAVGRQEVVRKMQKIMDRDGEDGWEALDRV